MIFVFVRPRARAVFYRKVLILGFVDDFDSESLGKFAVSDGYRLLSERAGIESLERERRNFDEFFRSVAVNGVNGKSRCVEFVFDAEIVFFLGRFGFYSDIRKSDFGNGYVKRNGLAFVSYGYGLFARRREIVGAHFLGYGDSFFFKPFAGNFESKPRKVDNVVLVIVRLRLTFKRYAFDDFSRSSVFEAEIHRLRNHGVFDNAVSARSRSRAPGVAAIRGPCETGKNTDFRAVFHLSHEVRVVDMETDTSAVYPHTGNSRLSFAFAFLSEYGQFFAVYRNEIAVGFADHRGSGFVYVPKGFKIFVVRSVEFDAYSV